MKRNALAWAAIVLSTAALISSQSLTRPVPAALQISPEEQKQARALGDAFNAVAEYVKPSVVQIKVSHGGSVLNRRNPLNQDPQGGQVPKELEELLKRFPGFGGRIEPQQFGGRSGGQVMGTGSGFVYDDKGHILTNNHVVEGAGTGKGDIKVEFSDGEEYSATIVGTDPKSDVAVIKVETTQYRPIPKGKSASAKVGDWVLAVGSPFGFDQTVTSGIISAVNRNEAGIIPNEGAYEDFIQTDAAINPGNSGGPLVDLDGRVIGINSAIATANSRSNSGVGFAIPIDMAANLADRIIKDGKVVRAQLGILLAPLKPAIARQLGADPKTKGVIAGEVVEGAPAAEAGVKDGDILTSFDGTSVSNVQAFRNMVSTSELGKSHTLTFLRAGKEQSVKVNLVPAETVMARIGRGEQSRRARPREVEAPNPGVERFGIEVQQLTPDLAKQFGFDDSAKGLIISDVKDGSPADAAGLRDGMLITKVAQNKNLAPVATVKQFEDLAAKTDELLIYAQNNQGEGKLFILAKPAR